MNTVWIINHYAAYPGDSATGSRHFSLARRLADLGWKPIILAASSEHNSDRQRLPDGVKRGTSVREGVEFRWLRTSGYAGNGLDRILNMVQFTLALLRPKSTGDLPRPDVIVGSTVHPFAAWAASCLAKRHAVPFIFEIRDLWPQTLIDMGKLRQNGIPALMMRGLEKYLCQRASSIITLLPKAGDYLETIGVDPRKVEWISNGTDAGEFETDPAAESEIFTFTYFGSLGTANGMPAILTAFAHAAKYSPERESRLVVVGEGPLKKELMMLASNLDFGERIEFRPAVPKNEIPVLAAQADCLVLNVLDLDLYRYGISLNKLFDYMAAARPIVIASNAANNPVMDADGGICVPANDAVALGDAMNLVMRSSSQERARWGENAARHVAKRYDYRVLGDQLDALLTRQVKVRQTELRSDG